MARVSRWIMIIKFKMQPNLSYIEIFNFFKSKNLFEEGDISNNKNVKINFNNDKKIILFFDEINSINYLNLLSDIFINHSYLDQKLKESIIITASLNFIYEQINEKNYLPHFSLFLPHEFRKNLEILKEGTPL